MSSNMPYFDWTDFIPSKGNIDKIWNDSQNELIYSIEVRVPGKEGHPQMIGWLDITVYENGLMTCKLIETEPPI